MPPAVEGVDGGKEGDTRERGKGGAAHYRPPVGPLEARCGGGGIVGHGMRAGGGCMVIFALTAAVARGILVEGVIVVVHASR